MCATPRNSVDSMEGLSLDDLAEDYKALKEMYDQLLERHSAAQNFIDRVGVFFKIDSEAGNPCNDSKDEVFAAEAEFRERKALFDKVCTNIAEKISEHEIVEGSGAPEDKNESPKIWNTSKDEEIEKLVTALREVTIIAEQVKMQSKQLVKKAAQLC